MQDQTNLQIKQKIPIRLVQMVCKQKKNNNKYDQTESNQTTNNEQT